MTVEELQAEVADLEHVVEVLKGALAAAGVEPPTPDPEWLRPVRGQGRALLGILFATYPKPLTTAQIEARLPGRASHEDRDISIVRTVIHQTRKVLGPEAIRTVPHARGTAYALGHDVHRLMQPAPSEPTACQ